MLISGLVITLDTDPEARAHALRVLERDPRITLGECVGHRMAAVSETTSSTAAEALVNEMFDARGISFIDVVYVDMSLEIDDADGNCRDTAAPSEKERAQGGPL